MRSEWGIVIHWKNSHIVSATLAPPIDRSASDETSISREHDKNQRAAVCYPVIDLADISVLNGTVASSTRNGFRKSTRADGV